MSRPLSDKGRMAHSIAQFVLAHPEHTDIIAAHNAWVDKEQWRSFPWSDPETVPFCLSIFNTCINRLDRKTLDDICYDEELFQIRDANSV